MTTGLRYKKHSWTNWILVFFLLYATDSAYVSSNDNRIWARVSWVIMIALFLGLLCLLKAKLKRSYIPLILLSVWIGLSMLMHGDIFNVNYYQRIVLIWLAVLVASYIEYSRFMDIFIAALKVIAVISLIGFVFHSYIERMDFLPIMTTGESSYRVLFFTNVKCYVPGNRNFGPFWEPGVYQLYLNWAVFWELRNQDKFKLFDIILFSLTILTTKSTAGVIILALIYLYYFLFVRIKRAENGAASAKRGKAFLVVLLIAAIPVVLNSESLMRFLFSKIFDFLQNRNVIDSGNISAYTRFYSVFANIDIIKRYPLFGIGIRNMKQAVWDSYEITSNTNSILAMPATYGIVSGLLYLWMFIKAAKNIGKDTLSRFLALAILIAMYSTENLIVSIVFYIILIYEGFGSKERVHDNECCMRPAYYT